MKPSFKPSAKDMAVPFRRDMESQVFLGVRSICSYLHIGPSTFYLWARDYDLTATRTPDGRWVTCTAMIDDWIRERLAREREADAMEAMGSVESEGAHG
ncbi:MAG: hypothetical protein ABI856_12120 [Nitrospira sp.]